MKTLLRERERERERGEFKRAIMWKGEQFDRVKQRQMTIESVCAVYINSFFFKYSSTVIMFCIQSYPSIMTHSQRKSNVTKQTNKQTKKIFKKKRISAVNIVFKAYLQI